MHAGRRRDSAKRYIHPAIAGWRGLVLALLAIPLFAFSFAASIEVLLDTVQFGGRYGAHLGGEYVLDSSLPAGHARLVMVEPGGVAASVGLKPGDSVRFEQPWLLHSYKQQGDVFAVSVARPDGERQIRFPATVAPMKPGILEAFLLFSLGKLIITCLCALMLIRGWGRPAPMFLSMLAFAYAAPNIPHWAQGQSIAWLVEAINQLLVCGMIGLPLFAMALYREEVGPVSRKWRWAMVALAAACLTLAVVRGYCVYWLASLPVVGNADGSRSALLSLSFGISMYWLWRGWKRGDAASRNRFAVIGLALLSYLAFYVAFFVALAILGLSSQQWLGSPLGLLLITLANLGAPVLLTYGVLRHKVIDTGFAISRTLMFTAISSSLLAAFGLLEWSVEHLLPEEFRKQSAWIDGGIALMLFLVFHRLRDAVEGVIERLFFRHWHDNENRLRRFVASAAHFERIPALCEAFAGELVRFSKGAQAAIYLRDGDVGYRLGAGEMPGAPSSFPADGPAFALLRAERKPLDLTSMAEDLPGNLALPMLDHGRLAGFVLMGSPPDGGDFRPDEVEVLGWAAHQVGIEVQAQRAADLELRAAEDGARIAECKRTIASLNRRLVRQTA